MNKILIAALIVVASAAQAWAGKSKFKNHIGIRNASRLSGTEAVSMDTLFCAGKPMAVVVNAANRDRDHSVFFQFKSKSGSDICMEVNYAEAEDKARYPLGIYQYSFPGMQMKCEIPVKDSTGFPYRQICRMEMFNEAGLDTFKIQMYATVYSRSLSRSGMRKSPYDTAEYMARSIIVPRDTTYVVLINEEGKVAQGGVLIGSVDEGFMVTPKGNLPRLALYNSIGALICTATCTDPVTGKWNLLTYKDNRFHTYILKDENYKTGLFRLLTRLGYV